jgi:lysophospholipase L1-like esterase
MARAMAEMEDVIAYIIDPVPNCTQMMCDTLTYDFIKIIRSARPRTPIIMVEGPMYPYAKFDSYFRDYLPAKNEAFRKNFERLKAEGDDYLYYVTCEGLTGPDEEGTVDGIHLTDLGFRAYADKLEEVIRRVVLK